MDEYLFTGGELRLALEAQAQKMREDVEAEPEENLKQADPAQWAAALAHHFVVACPELKADEVWMDQPKAVTLDVSGDRGRYFSDPYSDLARNYPASGSSSMSRSRGTQASSSSARVASRLYGRGDASSATSCC